MMGEPVEFLGPIYVRKLKLAGKEGHLEKASSQRFTKLNGAETLLLEKKKTQGDQQREV